MPRTSWRESMSGGETSRHVIWADVIQCSDVPLTYGMGLESTNASPCFRVRRSYHKLAIHTEVKNEKGAVIEVRQLFKIICHAC